MPRPSPNTWFRNANHGEAHGDRIHDPDELGEALTHELEAQNQGEGDAGVEQDEGTDPGP